MYLHPAAQAPGNKAEPVVVSDQISWRSITMDKQDEVKAKRKGKKKRAKECTIDSNQKYPF
jgi:hypothetical protein